MSVHSGDALSCKSANISLLIAGIQLMIRFPDN